MIVTIVTPTLNGMAFLERCIASVKRNQAATRKSTTSSSMGEALTGLSPTPSPRAFEF